MDQEVVNSLGNLKLTREEEEDIVVANSSSSGNLEECSLSLFGRLLSDRHQNLRALKNTLRAAWKMGSDLRIVEVGNSILQFKFGSKCQLEWVEKSGPWNFENNLLLLCRWRKGLTSKNICFSHSPFWVQIWGLPFENMVENFGREIGSKIGKVLEVDKRALQADQAKFLRVRVEVQLDKPLRRGGFVKNDENDRIWVDFRYERLPIFCYKCGILGHDDKHCLVNPMENPAGNQYGEWLKAGGALKDGGGNFKLKQQANAEMRGADSMGLNSNIKERNGGSGHSCPALAVGGGTEGRKGTVSLMDTDRMECVKSNPREHGEKVRTEDDVADALRSGEVQKSREVPSANPTCLVSQQMVDVWAGPDISVDVHLSPQRIKGADSFNGEKDCGPVMEALNATHKIRPVLKEKIISLGGEKNFGPDLKVNDAAQDMRPGGNGELNCHGEEAVPLCQERGLAQTIRRKFKRMARDKGKAQESVNAEKAQEVSNKRKALTDVLFASEETAQKRLCFGEKGGNVYENFETAVTAEQHRLDK